MPTSVALKLDRSYGTDRQELCPLCLVMDDLSDMSEEEKLDVELSGRTSILRDMSVFYNNEELSDVVLVVGDRKFYAHRFVLAKSSSVFKAMLYGKHWSESVREEVTLKETPECEAVFDLLIKYLYTAKVPIKVQTAVAILSLADKYDVESLKTLCVTYMENQSHVVQTETAVSWYTWAKNMHLDRLAVDCFEAITLNTGPLIRLKCHANTWIDLDIELLEEILSTSKLVIFTEHELFTGLSKWLLDESRVDSLKENSDLLLPLIRFSQMKISQLLVVKKSELATRTETSAKLQELLGRAFRFRAVCQTNDLADFSGDFFKPRDYLAFNIKFPDPAGLKNRGLCIIEKGDLKNKAPVSAEMGPAMGESEEGLWEISSECVDNSVWKVTLFAKDLLGKKVKIQFSFLVTDVFGKVIQCKRTNSFMWEARFQQVLEIPLTHPDKAFYLIVLIKPLPVLSGVGGRTRSRITGTSGLLNSSP